MGPLIKGALSPLVAIYYIFIILLLLLYFFIICWLALQPGLLVNLVISEAHQCCLHARLPFLGGLI